MRAHLEWALFRLRGGLLRECGTRPQRWSARSPWPAGLRHSAPKRPPRCHRPCCRVNIPPPEQSHVPRPRRPATGRRPAGVGTAVGTGPGLPSSRGARAQAGRPGLTPMGRAGHGLPARARGCRLWGEGAGLRPSGHVLPRQQPACPRAAERGPSGFRRVRRKPGRGRACRLPPPTRPPSGSSERSCKRCSGVAGVLCAVSRGGSLPLRGRLSLPACFSLPPPFASQLPRVQWRLVTEKPTQWRRGLPPRSGPPHAFAAVSGTGQSMGRASVSDEGGEVSGRVAQAGRWLKAKTGRGAALSSR